MSFMRYPVYVWDDGDAIHFWNRAGVEGQGKAWANDDDAWNGAIYFPLAVFDQVAVMRVAELLKEGQLSAVAEQARGSGNFGSWDLREMLGEDPAQEFRDLLAKSRASKATSTKGEGREA